MDKNEYKQIIEQSLIEKGYLTEPSFEDKLDSIVNDSFEEINNTNAMELLEKCGKGPSTGYVDGVQYKKDYQRVTNGEAKVGDLEQKQMDYQLSQKELHNPRDPDAPRWRDPRSQNEREIEKCLDFPEDMIGVSIHGDDYVTGNIEEPGDEDYGGSYGWDGGMERDTGAYWNELEGASDNFAHEMDNAPPLQDNVMLFTRDIPNPNLEEGDVFELDSYLGVNFKKGMLGQYDDMWSNVNIPLVRRTGTDNDNYSGRDYDYEEGEAYEVTVLGSEGTPLLMEEPYRQGGSYHINVHEGILNKGQKVRLVRVNHDKRTAIYQTVEG